MIHWGAIVPLIGGQVLGTRDALGRDPSVMISFDAFAANDTNIRRYLPHVPFELAPDRGGDLTKWKGKLSLVVSTCPCAGLSMLSPHKADDPRRADKNKWMLYTTELVLRDIQPKLLFGENAPQLATRMGSGVRDGLRELATTYGYTLIVTKVSSVLAGIPQHRERSFYYFFRGNEAPDLLHDFQPTPLIPLSDYVAKARSRDDDPQFEFELETDPIFQFLRKRFGTQWRTAGGRNEPINDGLQAIMRSGLIDDFCAEYPEPIDLPGPYNSAQARMLHRLKAKKEADERTGVYAQPPILPRGDGWYPAVTAKTAERLVHPTENRYLTYREAAHMMGLPGDFQLPARRDWNMICQNVPVTTAAWATQLVVPWLMDEPEPTARGEIVDLYRGRWAS